MARCTCCMKGGRAWMQVGWVWGLGGQALACSLKLLLEGHGRKQQRCLQAAAVCARTGASQQMPPPRRPAYTGGVGHYACPGHAATRRRPCKPQHAPCCMPDRMPQYPPPPMPCSIPANPHAHPCLPSSRPGGPSFTRESLSGAPSLTREDSMEKGGALEREGSLRQVGHQGV